MPAAKKAALSDELAAEATPPTKPAGSPALVPFLAAPRRARAQFMRKIEPILTAAEKLGGQKDTSIGTAAGVYDMLADAEDLLAQVAVDETAFREWSGPASDDDLLGLFSWYVGTFQPGEAKPSSS